MFIILDELVTNIVTHGECDDLTISITVWINAFKTTIDVRDNGKAFNPLTLPAPNTDLALQDRSIGGLGIHLCRQLTHGMSYERTGEHNRLRLTRHNVRNPSKT